jgi:hypothetical protein
LKEEEGKSATQAQSFLQHYQHQHSISIIITRKPNFPSWLKVARAKSRGLAILAAGARVEKEGSQDV